MFVHFFKVCNCDIFRKSKTHGPLHSGTRSPCYYVAQQMQLLTPVASFLENDSHVALGVIISAKVVIYSVSSVFLSESVC